MADENGEIIPPPQPIPPPQTVSSGANGGNPLGGLAKEPLGSMFILGGLFLMFLGDVLSSMNVSAGGAIISALGAFCLSMVLFLVALLRRELDPWVRGAVAVAAGIVAAFGL